MAELARTDDLLEQQLEKLFSDTVLSPLIREDQRRAPSNAAAPLPFSTSSAVSIPQSGSRRRLLKPNWLTGASWKFAILAGLAVVLVMAVAFFEPMSLTQSANIIPPPPWHQPTAQVRATAGSLAYRSPQTLTPSQLSATSTKSIPVVTILPAARQSIQPSATPTSSPLPTVGAQYEPTDTTATEGMADLTFDATPNPTTSAIGEAETSRPLPPIIETTVTAPPAEPVTDLESAVPPTKTSGAEPMYTYEPSPTATIITRAAQPTTTFVPTSVPPPVALAPSSPTRILIPAINLEAPIITVGFENYAIDGKPVTTWAVPAYYAVGWHHTSAPPGKAGNTVLNGHQNIHGGVFRNLGALQRNDEIIVYSNGAAHHYRVVEQHILKEEGQPLEVRAENARWIMSTPDERLTLVTCAPGTANSDRLIIVALPDQPPTQ